MISVLFTYRLNKDFNWMEPWKGCGFFIVVLVILSRKYFILFFKILPLFAKNPEC